MRTLIIITTILIFATICFGQLSTSTTGARNIQADNAAVEAKVAEIIKDAGIYFKQGLLNLQDNRRPQARVDFDKSIEVFLISNINIKAHNKLNNCYNQLIETIYRIEFPSDKQPAIKIVTMTCGWNIDDLLIESIVTFPQPTKTPIGFADRKFEPSPLDKLSKLELTKEDIEIVNTPSNQVKVNQTPKINIGKKPVKFKGEYTIIKNYIYTTFHDPYSVKYLKWSEPFEKKLYDQPYWCVIVTLRAKNLFNAYRLTSIYFFIRNDKIFYAIDYEKL